MNAYQLYHFHDGRLLEVSYSWLPNKRLDEKVIKFRDTILPNKHRCDIRIFYSEIY